MAEDDRRRTEAAEETAEAAREEANAVREEAAATREEAQEVGEAAQAEARAAQQTAEAAQRSAAAAEQQAAAIQQEVENLRQLSEEEIEAIHHLVEQAVAQHPNITREDAFAEFTRQMLIRKENNLNTPGLQEYLEQERQTQEGIARAQQRQNAIKQALGAAGMLGAGAAAGARGLGRAARAGARTAGRASQAVRNAARSDSNPQPKRKSKFVQMKNKVSYLYYLIITLIIHFIIMLNPVANDGLFILYYMTVFTFITGFYIFWHWHDEGEVRGALIATVLGLIMYLLPAIFTNFFGFPTGGPVLKAVSFAVWYCPVWPLFCAVRFERVTKSRLFHLLFTAWKVILLLCVLVMTVNIMSSYGLPIATSFDLGSPIDIGANAWEFIKDLWEDFFGIFTGTWGLFQRATNPSTYYTGQVEDNVEVPMGVEFEELRVADELVGNETPIIVFGTVRARPIKSQNFLGESVLVRPNCLIQKDGTLGAAIDPHEMDIVWGTFGQFECEFPPLGKAGTYTIEGTATFPFQTRAYIEYTFISDELARSEARKGNDVAEVLGIRQKAEAIYTGGPVLLGMGGTPQPITVNPEGGATILPAGTRVGITLDTNWYKGEIQHVDRLELKAPEPFKLTECDRDPVRPSGEKDPFDPLYTTWTFDNPDIDPLVKYASVTCKVVLPDKQDAIDLLQTKTNLRSFVGVAYYTFSVEEKVTVKVR